MRFAVTHVFVLLLSAPYLSYSAEPENTDLNKAVPDKFRVISPSPAEMDPPDLPFRTVIVDPPLIQQCERVCRKTTVAAECIRKNCKTSFAIPDRDVLVNRAIRFANTRFNNEYRLINVQTYVDAREKPVSYLVVLGKESEMLPKRLSKSGIISKLLSGHDPAQWDDIVVWADVSTDSRYSPIRSSGTGVPAEWLALKQIKQLHNKKGEITKRYFSALSPVFEFTDERGERFFYQHIMPGKLASSIQFGAPKPYRAPTKSRTQWFHFINQGY